MVSRDNVRIAFLLVALNALDDMACDIRNDFLNAEHKENILFVNGKECRVDQGEALVITRKPEGPLPTGYWPELYVKPECKTEMISRFQKLIGNLQLAMELGRIDILMEVSMLSQLLANPMEGNLKRLYLTCHFC